MNLDLARHWITHWEGTRLRCYKDSRGIATVGVGFNLTAAGARRAITQLGVDYEALAVGTVGLNRSQVDQLLLGSLAIAAGGARALIGNFEELPEDRQLILIDLVFNLGQQTLSKFVRTLGFIRRQDWEGAAAELEASDWFKQVGTKANERGGADVAVLRGTTTVAAVLGIPGIGSGTLERVEAVACLPWAA